jgi:hypothetical protein
MAVEDIAARKFSKEEYPGARTATGLVLQRVSVANDSSDEDDGDDYPSSSTSSRCPPWRLFSALSTSFLRDYSLCRSPRPFRRSENCLPVVGPC